jgi:hypothetical protein
MHSTCCFSIKAIHFPATLQLENTFTLRELQNSSDVKEGGGVDAEAGARYLTAKPKPSTWKLIHQKVDISKDVGKHR